MNSEKIDEFEFPYYELPKMAEAYTRMWIIDVKKSELINEPLQLELFNKSKVTLTDELRAATSFLISPYDKTVQNIEIAFYNNGIQIASGFDLEILNFAESVNNFEIQNINGKIELNMSLKLTPQFIEKRIDRVLSRFRISRNIEEKKMSILNFLLIIRNDMMHL